MTNRKSMRHFLLLALLLCLTGCGAQEDAAGQDWRVSGMVVGSGAITREGETVDVLVTVGENRAAFYLDAPEQALYGSVTFPETQPNARECFQAVSFSDLDGDGASDVQLSFCQENGDVTELVWRFDPAAGYVFQESRTENHSDE